MFNLAVRSPLNDGFSTPPDVARMFDHLWSDLPRGAAASPISGLQVRTTDDGWRIDIPIPGIAPEDVALEASGNTVSIRTAVGDDKDSNSIRYERSFTVPRFLDLDKMTASYRHGMLELRLPLKESVKPRRIPIIEDADANKWSTLTA